MLTLSHYNKIMAYNTTTHKSTNTTPFQAMYGRHAKIPIDLLVHLPDQEENVPANLRAFPFPVVAIANLI